MTTSSTKSTTRKRGGKDKTEPTPVVERTEGELPDIVWRTGAIAILVIGAAFRFYNLNLVPLHHDEGVNGNFLVRLVRDGFYQYDPGNYHGPTLYYFTAIISWIIRLFLGTHGVDTYGLNTVTIRLVTGFFGLGSIALIFVLRRRLGSVATLAAGLMLAVSPGAVYLSRYYIHESLFVFFTLGIVVAAIKFYDERNLIYLLLASISAALLFGTKETAMISAAVLLIAFGVTYGYLRYLGEAVLGKRTARLWREKWQTQMQEFYKGIGGSSGLLLGIALSVVLFAFVHIIFYSSFFTNAKGIYDSVRTFAIWSKTGNKEHVHDALTYFTWLIRQESPLLFLGAIGAAFAVLKPKNSSALFMALWSFGLIAAYSLVPYKTPWLALNFIVPLALIAGYAVQAIYELDRAQLRLPIIVIFAAIGIATYQMIDLNFYNYDNDDQKYVYVYAHSKRPMLDLVKEVDKYASHVGGPQTGISVVSPDYWPLPWYFRNYKRVGYYNDITPTTEPIIIASETQQEKMTERFGERYILLPSGAPGGGYELRPGVSLLLYVRNPNPVPTPSPTP